MAGGMFIFSAVDTQAKFLTDTLHPFQIVWFRQLGLVLGLVFMLSYHGASILRTAAPGLQVLRGAVAAGSATLFIFAVSYVPLADAVAVTFVAPFMVTLMGALILREPVGMRRWTAVIIGFLATLIIIRPGTGAIHPAAFLVILAAALFAVRQIVSRALAGSDNTMTTVAYTALVSVALLSVPLPFVWQWPTEGWQIALLISMALMAALAETLVIKALELAQAVVVAPLHYTILIWSTFYGWLIFGDLPDLWTWVGAAIITATGIYTLNRERLAARKPPQT
ncbi:protein of unknown function DUF6 transmembrane [Candidatus Rhodobacter oscarellae]|uniref:EamA domain-containing protein n=2 Tax=Candidatus Rhodobacter oscarellae TaxID=1675527 RepID=A0A0J9E183_9RHOB|nr:protein of unknown function DUF6 transmembrane [Candidatus Rhodobacter lobularis]